VERQKKRLVEDGMEQVLERWPVDFGVRPFKFDGTFEAKPKPMPWLVASLLMGRAGWVRLLAREGHLALRRRLDFAVVRTQDS
jgi:hypothetical protein